MTRRPAPAADRYPQLLYFSLEPHDVRDEIDRVSDELASQYGRPGRRVAQDRLHLSLHGIAVMEDIPPDLRRLAARAGDAVVARPFEICLDRILNLKGNSHIVLVPSRPVPALLNLHDALDRALTEVGWDVGRVGRDIGWPGCRTAGRVGFYPHVTLFREGLEVPARELPEPVHWLASDFSLMLTVPGMPATPTAHGSTGTRRPVQSWPLRTI